MNIKPQAMAELRRVRIWLNRSQISVDVHGDDVLIPCRTKNHADDAHYALELAGVEVETTTVKGRVSRGETKYYVTANCPPPLILFLRGSISARELLAAAA